MLQEADEVLALGALVALELFQRRLPLLVLAPGIWGESRDGHGLEAMRAMETKIPLKEVYRGHSKKENHLQRVEVEFVALPSPPVGILLDSGGGRAGSHFFGQRLAENFPEGAEDFAALGAASRARGDSAFAVSLRGDRIWSGAEGPDRSERSEKEAERWGGCFSSLEIWWTCCQNEGS